MSIPSTLSTARIAILGLGLMGGSLALALRGKCLAVFAADMDLGTVSLAQEEHLVDRATQNPAEILPDADIVILAAPVGAILDLVDQLPSLHPGSPVVIDLGSTKEQIVRRMEALPARFDPIGAHPMCGKETSGLQNADAKLFLKAAFALIPLERTSSQARRLAEEIARAVGSEPIWLDPTTHDHWVASTSHLPYLMAVALALSTPAEATPLVGPGFRGASRLAASSATMMGDVLRTNRENIVKALGNYRQQLERLEKILCEPGSPGLAQTLESGSAARRQLVGTHPAEVQNEPDRQSR